MSVVTRVSDLSGMKVWAVWLGKPPRPVEEPSEGWGASRMDTRREIMIYYLQRESCS